MPGQSPRPGSDEIQVVRSFGAPEPQILRQVFLAPIAILCHRIKRAPRCVIEHGLVNAVESVLDPELQRTRHLPPALLAEGFLRFLVGLFHVERLFGLESDDCGGFHFPQPKIKRPLARTRFISSSNVSARLPAPGCCRNTWRCCE